MIAGHSWSDLPLVRPPVTLTVMGGGMSRHTQSVALSSSLHQSGQSRKTRSQRRQRSPRWAWPRGAGRSTGRARWETDSMRGRAEPVFSCRGHEAAMFCLCLQVRREPRAPLEIQVKASKGLTGPRASEVPHFLSGSSALKAQCALTTAQDEFVAAA